MEDHDRPAPNDPQRPHGVRIRRPNGQVIPLELTYRGVRDCKYVWEGVTPLGAEDQVLIDTMPLDTAIDLPWKG